MRGLRHADVVNGDAVIGARLAEMSKASDDLGRLQALGLRDHVRPDVTTIATDANSAQR
jgi:hypothetical protein